VLAATMALLLTQCWGITMGKKTIMRLDPHDNTAKDYARARKLRNNASPIENKLWLILREAAKANGLIFRRQQVLHPYIADFACMKARLLIELDGDTHADSKEYDDVRDNKLRRMGFIVLRFANDDVVQNVEGMVMEIIRQAVRLVQNNKRDCLRISPLPRIKCGAGSNPPRKGEEILSCPTKE